MKISIRTKFTLGIVFFFLIILVLSALSAFHLNKLSKKTGTILKDNHFSVVYARDMSVALNTINQEIVNCFLINKPPDSVLIKNTFSLFDKSLQLENNNITEPGEDKLVSGIKSGYNEYRDSVAMIMKIPKSVDKVLYLQNKADNLNKQLMLLSQMNEKAIELKTNDAKLSAKKALTQMTIIGTVCFLIALSFTYNFGRYFSERFFQLYNGIKEIVSSNYGQRLDFEGKDEFYDISLVFNEMAEKLNENKQKSVMTLKEDLEKNISLKEVQELKIILAKMKNIEEQAIQLISKLESKK